MQTFQMIFTHVLGGMAFTLGAMLTCKVMRWAPVSIIINNHQIELPPR
jgi:hypothetical protein